MEWSWTIWVYLAKYLDIVIWFRISPRFQRCYPTLLHWATAFFQVFLENTQFEFMEKNIWTLPFGSEFPPGSRDVIENSIRPYSIGLPPLGYGIFFFKWAWKICNLSLWRKIFEHFSIGLRDFFKNDLADFWRKYSPGFLRDPFLHCKTY